MSVSPDGDWSHTDGITVLKGGSEPVRISPPELWLLLIVLDVNIFVAFYERSVGRRVGSSILIADATHTISDIWVTISVIGGLIGVWLGYQWMDLVLAFPVALLVFWSGWSVLKENLPWLVDTNGDRTRTNSCDRNFCSRCN